MRLSAKIAFIAAALFLCSNIPDAKSEEATRAILKNGLVVLVQEEHNAPLTAIEAQIRTGSASEYGYLGSGISHFLEHMLFKGTKRWPEPGAIDRQIKSLGGYINAYTTQDVTGVHLIVPSEYTDEALEITKDILTEATIDPAESEKEKEVILKEIRLDNDDPGRFTSRLLWSTMFKAHNYRLPVIGYEDVFKVLKAEDVKNYYRANYVPDNMVLGVVGDVKKAEVLDSIDKIFGAIERTAVPPRYFQEEPPQVAPLNVRIQKEVSLAYLSLGFRSVSVRDKDMYGLDVLAMILGTGGDSRLYKKLYMEKRLAPSISCYNYTPKDPGIFVINAVLEDKNTDAALAQIWGQIEYLKKNPVPEAELQKAKNIVLNDYILSRQTAQEELSDLVSGETTTGDYDFSKRYVEGINAVTKEMVRDAAKKYLTKENSTLALLVPKKTEKGQGAGNTPSAPGYKIDRFELGNDLRVLILEDHRLPIANVSIIGMGGIRSETRENNGIANLTADTLLCGTAARTEGQILSQIESAGGSIGSSISSNNFVVSGEVLSKDYGLLLDICADVIKNPRFPRDMIDREKGVIRENIKSVNDDIYALGARTLKYTLFRHHPYRFSAMGRTDVVDRASREEILNYYSSYYTPGNMILALSGDIDPKAAREKITALFGKLQRKQAAAIRPAEEKKMPRPRILTRTIVKEQSVIMLGFLGSRAYEHDKYVLGVLASVLSGVNGRLSKSIREAKGLAYSLNAASLPGLERGMFVFYIGTAKENLNTAKDELFNEIGLIKKEGVTDEELRSAKKELSGAYKIWLQRTQDIAIRAATDELSGADHLDFMKFEERVKHITKECVDRAARKYLDDNSYVLLTIRGQ